MFKKILALSMSAILLTTACGCSFQPDSVKDIVSNFTDNKNPYPVQIGHNTIDSAPDTVVVLDNNVADILVTCGYKDKIVGISSDCIQQELSAVEKMGSDSNPKTEAVNKANADIIFASSNIGHKDYEELKENNKVVLRIAPAKDEASLTGLYINLCKIMEGNIKGEAKGKEFFSKTIDSINKYSENPIIAKGCYLFDLDDSSAVTNDMYANTILKYAGVQNIATDNNKNGNMPIAQILASDKHTGFPFYILCETGLKAKILSDNRFSTTNVVNKNRIIEIPSTMITTQGKGAIGAIEYISSAIAKQNDIKGESLAENYGISIVKGMSYTIGEEDSNVQAIQQRLDDLGYLPINPTGYFGDTTAIAVKDFQTNNELDRRDGVADYQTITRLFSTSAFSRAIPVKSHTNSNTTVETATEDTTIVLTF